MASSHIQKLSPQFRLKRKSYTWLALVANNCSITLDFFGDNNYNSVAGAAWYDGSSVFCHKPIRPLLTHCVTYCTARTYVRTYISIPT